MSAGAALELLQWLLLVVLTLAVGGLVRLVRLLEQRVAESFGEPRRIQVGDALSPPDPVAALVTRQRAVLMLFGSSSCSSCQPAYRRLDAFASANSEVRLVSLWREEPPGYADDATALPHQVRTFEELRVGVTPFAVLLSDGVVRARGAIGSPSAAESFEEAAQAAIREIADDREGIR